jgi:hypothetical protein
VSQRALMFEKVTCGIEVNLTGDAYNSNGFSRFAQNSYVARGSARGTGRDYRCFIANQC